MPLDDTLTIILGFGGSGGKTIAKLMEFMAQDPQAAEIARKSTSVILCDTDEGELEEASEAVRKSFEGRGLVEPPPVYKFSLADGVDLFQDLVDRKISSMSPESQGVIRQHWWFEDQTTQSKPFSAPTMPEKVSRGAGQCPLVSHFLAWDKIPAFERILDAIVEDAKNRRHMEHFSVDLFIVGSLAGGTGRGCWQSLSLKAREYFWADRGGRRACRPIGFFLDSSIFKDVSAQRPEQRIKLAVNSLTGLSELAMWLRSSVEIDSIIGGGNPELARERRVFLPSLIDPLDENANPVDTNRYMREEEIARVGRTPIHRAYIFTDRSSSTVLNTSEDAYHIVSASMFGRLAISHTRTTDANEPERAGASATSVLYVPISDLRLCVLNAARSRRVELLMNGSKFDSAKISDAERFLMGYIELESAPVFSALAQAQLDPTSPLSMLVHDIVAKTTNSICDKQTRERLKKDLLVRLVGDAKTKVKCLDHGITLIRVFGKSLIGREEGVLVGQDIHGIGGLADSLILKIREKHVEPALKHGVVPALQVIQKMLVVLTEGRKKLTDQQALSSAANVPSKEGTAGSMTSWIGQCYGIFGFKAQIATLFKKKLASELAESAYPGVLKVMVELIDSVAEVLESWDASLQEVEKEYSKQRDEFKKQHNDKRAELFTVMPSGQEGGGSLKAQAILLDKLEGDVASPVSKLIRHVRPVYNREDFEKLVGGLVDNQIIAFSAQEEMVEFIRNEALATKVKTVRRGHEFRSSVRERLKTVVERQGIDFEQLRPHFGLQKVLKELVDLWFEVWKDRQGDQEFAGKLERQIEIITGLNPRKMFDSERRGGSQTPQNISEFYAPSSDQVLISAAIKLASSCDPFVEYLTTGDRRDRATVFLPDTDVTKLNQLLISGIVKTANDRKEEFAHLSSKTLPASYFMLVATSDLPRTNFVDQGWDGWFSAPSDPQITKWLEWAEEGTAAFKSKDGSVGLGYLSPQYINDPHFSARRWKPWVDPRRQSIKMHRKWLALSYALLGNMSYVKTSSADWYKKYMEFVDTFRKVFEETSGPNANHPTELWKFPLLLEAHNDGKGPVFQRPLFNKNRVEIRQNGLDIAKNCANDISSMRKFVAWFESDSANAAIESIIGEQVIFSEILKRDTGDLHNVTSKSHRDALQIWLKEYVRQWRVNIESLRGLSAEDKDKQTEFLLRFEAFLEQDGIEHDLLKSFLG